MAEMSPIAWVAVGLFALLGPLGCHETPSPPSHDVAASATAASTASAATPTAVGSAASNDAPAPTLEGSEVTIKLRNGASLTMPKAAVPKDLGAKTAALPDSVEKPFVFEVGEKRLLMVTQLKDDGKSCSDYLGQEWDKMKRAKDDPNEKRREFRRVQRIEDLNVGGTRVLYGETLQRGFFQAEKRPFAGMASANMCRDGVAVAIMFATTQPTLPAGSQAMIEAIVKSYKK